MAELAITGYKRLVRQFAALGSGGQNRVMRPSLRAGTKPMVKVIRSLVPVDEGLLKKSIGTQINTYKRSGAVIIRIGARSGFSEIDEDGKKRDPIRYAHLVEGGTIFQGPRSFLRAGMDSTRGTATTIINKEVGKRVKKELAKTK